MTLDVHTTDLTVHHGRTTALDGVTLSLPGGRIHGLLGRNGSGKTTLASVLAAFRRPTAGQVTVGGRDPYEDATTTRQVCLIHEGTVSGDELGTLDDVLGMAARFRPHWDHALAAELVDRFELPRHGRASRFSRGQRSALGVTIGLASRAPLTIFDEAHLGMDAPARAAFTEVLLADYMQRPRTIVLATHLVEESAHLFEQVTVLHRGRVLLQDDADTLRERGAVVTGPADRVDRFVTGRRVLAARRLGSTTRVTVDGPLTDRERRDASAVDLAVAPIGLQELFVGLTSTPEIATREKESA